MKKFGYYLGLLPQLLLIAGAYAVKYFTAKKMGMARHVIYKNQIWEKTYPLDSWKMISVMVLAVLLITVIALLLKRKDKLSRLLLAEGVLAAGLTVFSLYFTLTNSVATLRPYYWMSPLFAAAALLQQLRTLLLLLHKAA